MKSRIVQGIVLVVLFVIGTVFMNSCRAKSPQVDYTYEN
jgi:hypothetical protein